MSEWIEWKGGECPVPVGTLVDVRFRNGYSAAAYPADKFRWARIENHADIVAYRLHEPAEQAEPSALQTQIGGDHYKKLAIQPMQYSMANKLDACQHTIIKYVTRFRDKGGVADLEKARHTIDLLIEMERKA